MDVNNIKLEGLSDKPKLFQIGISLSTWLFMFIGVIALRAEIHPWINVLILTAVFPAYIWFMSRNNILGSMQQGALIAAIIGATLFMTMLLEARPKSKFSVGLKKDLKEFGKDSRGTAKASIAVAVSLAAGVVTSYLILQDNFTTL